MQGNEQMNKRIDRYKEIYQNYNDDQETGRYKEIRSDMQGSKSTKLTNSDQMRLGASKKKSRIGPN